ncbi:phage tail protein [Candidatus Pantoea multigeneris]|uniref:Phage tail protein n=1 Tax=Candidatus Pantoea multigeneris TaxID=2608357 RepID=A0ABX0RA46_9GAMM|nr:phage tail protein [Pantoea multigeneris]NIF20574.1 phage tail protein [Pantoea multigeneris]
MAIDTFSWAVRIGAEEQLSVAALSAQFGDGYSQIASAGINAAIETWTLSCNGDITEMKQVRSFLKDHVITSFWWENPWGEKKLYRVKKDSITPNFTTGVFVDISFTFLEAPSP